MKPDISKFSFGQLTSNSDGKTSGSGFSGVYICFMSMLCFIGGVIDKMFFTKSPDIMSYSLMALTIGAGLLGYRKSKEKSIPVDSLGGDETVPDASKTDTLPENLSSSDSSDSKEDIK